MSDVLAILANPRPNSHTERLLDGFVTAYCAQHPSDNIIMRDLYQMTLPTIGRRTLAAWEKPAAKQNSGEKALLSSVNRFTSEFIAADKIIFAAPMWNLQFPPLLTAYLATIVVAGQTFRYTETGSEGLVADKPAILLHIRGGIYSHGAAQQEDFAVPYLRAVLKLIGISRLQTVICEGIECLPHKEQALFTTALADAERAASTF